MKTPDNERTPQSARPLLSDLYKGILIGNFIATAMFCIGYVSGHILGPVLGLTDRPTSPPAVASPSVERTSAPDPAPAKPIGIDSPTVPANQRAAGSTAEAATPRIRPARQARERVPVERARTARASVSAPRSWMPGFESQVR